MEAGTGVSSSSDQRERGHELPKKWAGLPGFLLLILTNDGALAVEPGVQSVPLKFSQFRKLMEPQLIILILLEDDGYFNN